jgi:hypothetical protein
MADLIMLALSPTQSVCAIILNGLLDNYFGVNKQMHLTFNMDVCHDQQILTN